MIHVYVFTNRHKYRHDCISMLAITERKIMIIFFVKKLCLFDHFNLHTYF